MRILWPPNTEVSHPLNGHDGPEKDSGAPEGGARETNPVCLGSKTSGAPTFSVSNKAGKVKLWGLPKGFGIGYNKGMRKMVSHKKVVIGAIALLFLFGLNLASAQVRGFATGVSSPFLAALWHAGDNVSTFFAGGSLHKENELLWQENLALQQEIVALQDIQKENQELRTILDLGLPEEFNLVMGQIIAKNLAQDVITITGGTNKGIREGMPVITASKVAVGRVTEVFEDHAKVQLLSAKDKKLEAKIAETAVTGVVQGQGGQRFMFDLVPQEDEFAPGDMVVTSSLGNIFPENILIGKVTEVIKSGADPFQKADLEPYFNLKTAEFVLVIVS